MQCRNSPPGLLVAYRIIAAMSNRLAPRYCQYNLLFDYCGRCPHTDASEYSGIAALLAQPPVGAPNGSTA